MKEIRFEGHTFNCEVVARTPKEDFVTREAKRYWLNKPDRADMLATVHDLCTKECEGVELAPPKPVKKPPVKRARKKK